MKQCKNNYILQIITGWLTRHVPQSNYFPKYFLLLMYVTSLSFPRPNIYGPY